MNPPAGFFTGVAPDRYKLPHPRLGFPVILLIRRVLCMAFETLREKGFDLATAQEDELTMRLGSVIVNVLWKSGTIAGFNSRTFHPSVRQGEVANYDLTKRAKTPDLSFRLQHDDLQTRKVLPEFDALFLECKPVDKKHPVGSKYCDDGLIRFVNGDYAWAMQEGMMLAYVRDAKTIASDLIPTMSKTKQMTKLGTVQLPQPHSVGKNPATDPRAEPIHISKHRRKFNWLDNKGPATDITIYHLWHDCE